MSGLYIVVSDNYRIIAHIVHEPREEMSAVGCDVVVVIRRVVALKTVAGIEQQHVAFTHGIPEAVDIPVDLHQAVRYVVVHIGAVKPGAVHVPGRHYVQAVPLSGDRDRGGQDHDSRSKTMEYSFHTGKNSENPANCPD